MDRMLTVLIIVVSLSLTALTVWAVARQGRALRAWELADIRSSARAAAARQTERLQADIDRQLDAAKRAWRSGDFNEFDAWISGQVNWLLACADDGDQWMIFPRTPLEAPLPRPDAAAEEATEAENAPLGTLDRFRRLATSQDPLTRAGALLALAAAEQQLGHPLAAARIFADAAHLLRSTPTLARFAFRAELSRVESLIDAADLDAGRESFFLFLQGLLTDHPSRLGPTELHRLEQLRTALALDRDSPAANLLDTLRQRVDRRVDIASSTTELPAVAKAEAQAEPRVISGMTSGGERIVIALAMVSDDTRVALVSTAERLIERVWDVTMLGQTWQVRLPDERETDLVLMKLGPEFGHAVIEPTPATATRLQRASQRRLGVVAVTVIGSVGAWLLVIWMMFRVVAHQRELIRLRDRFVADVSHELKTPLALIRLLAETLHDGRVRNPDRIRSYHETITRESERLTVLLDNILDMGRIESGRKQYEFAPCDLGDIARQAWTLFEPQLAREGFETRLEIGENLPTIRADAQALQQVIMNLLQNAYRYSDERKYIRLAVRREGFVVLIIVEDRGIGMGRDELHRLGESFFRADDKRVRKTRGTGLGLAIVHHIVTAHHGKIEVQSRPQQGSTFTVWIPFEPED